MTTPAGYIGGAGVQPMMSAAEAQVVGQMPTQQMLPGLMVSAPMQGMLPGLTPAFAEVRTANEHSEHMVRNLLIGFDMFERYFQQMEKHATLMEANNTALLQHTQALLDLEKQLTKVRQDGAKAAEESTASLGEAHKHLKGAASTLTSVADGVQGGAPAQTPTRGRPGRQTSGEDTDRHRIPPSPEPPSPTNILDDYKAGGVPRVVAARMERHYANRIKSLKGDRLNELDAMETRSPQEETEYQGLLDKTKHARSGVRVAQNVEQKGVMGSLGGEFPMVARFAGAAGMIGAAYEGVQKVAQMVSGEREQAAQYQQGIGGSTAGGLYQGAKERLFGFRNMFGMGESQSRELFRGVTAMGIDDAQGRQSALDFATQAFKDTGLQVSQSLEVIRTAASAGVTDFSQLAGSIKEVSKAAREGGISVAQSVQMFNQNMAGVQGTVGGQTAISVATNLTTGLAALGPDVANNVNLTGLYTDRTQQFRTAGQLGITRSALIGREMANPSFAEDVGQHGLDQIVDNVFGPQGRAWVARRVQELVKGGLSEQMAAQQVVEEATQNHILNLDTAEALAKSYGIPVTDEVAFAIALVQAAAGGLNIGAGKQTSATAKITTRPGAKGGQLLTLSSADRNAVGSVAALTGTRDAYTNLNPSTASAHDRLLHNVTVQQGQISKSLGYGTGKPLSNNDVSNYQGLVEQYGKRNPVIEALLKKGVYDSNTRFRVQTKDGPRDVSLGIAMHHYLDQLERGDVEITSGAHKNHKVSEILAQNNVQADPNATGANMDPNSAKDSTTQGAIKSQYSKKPKSGSDGATVIIKPSPDLQRILRLYPSGGAYIDDGRQSGQPSPAFAPYNDAATSGTGY